MLSLHYLLQVFAPEFLEECFFCTTCILLKSSTTLMCVIRREGVNIALYMLHRFIMVSIVSLWYAMVSILVSLLFLSIIASPTVYHLPSVTWVPVSDLVGRSETQYTIQIVRYKRSCRNHFVKLGHDQRLESDVKELSTFTYKINILMNYHIELYHDLRESGKV